MELYSIQFTRITPKNTVRLRLPFGPHKYIGHQCAMLGAYFVTLQYPKHDDYRCPLPNYGFDFNLVFNCSWKKCILPRITL